MNADEIRKTEIPDNSGGRILFELAMRREIAAQLADLNEQLEALRCAVTPLISEFSDKQSVMRKIFG